MQNKKFCGFEHAKMHCEFTYTTNAFQDESWDLSNFICYEGCLIYSIQESNLKFWCPIIKQFIHIKIFYFKIYINIFLNLFYANK